MSHGTSYAYNKKACRCEKCREWKRQANADRKIAIAQPAPRLRAADLTRFNRVCHYADAHSLTLKRAAEELLSYA